MVLLGTHWEHGETIDNIINDHSELGENMMELYGTQWEQKETQNSKKFHPPPPKENIELLGYMLPHFISPVGDLFLNMLVTIFGLG